MKVCPFCRIDDETPQVWGSELVLALHDRYPVSPGHTLLIPRRHVATYFDASAEEQAELWRGVEAVKAFLDQELKPDGYNVGFNAGEAAGQTVMHLHIHVIPRYRGDMEDPRGGIRGVIPHKQKYGAFHDLPRFVPGEEKSFGAALRSALQRAERADFVAAFIQTSGLNVLLPDMQDALERGARLRVLTGDYLNVTSADALRRLFSLAQEYEGCEVALYETFGHKSFHPKSYVFRHGAEGVAYVGSSNLSASALGSGVEWNLRMVPSDDASTFATIEQRFEDLWRSPSTRPLTKALIDEYEKRAPVPPAPEPRAARPVPHDIQVEALRALHDTRGRGQRRGLVVLATGLGKTFLSAFDFLQMGGERALFVAHREEILHQAKEAWARIFPEKTVGILGTGRHERDADLLFASVQTLARKTHLSTFPTDHFDYVVVDEFHHAAAATYRKVLGYFTPRFLLGLTATPDRLDGASLLALCDDNLVFRRDLLHGIGSHLLVPFSYFGVRDEVDFAPIPWRSGRFDSSALTEAVATQSRAEQALREYRRRAWPDETRRTLAFCVSTAHADFMAKFFRDAGVPAAAVHSGPTSAPRAESLRRLKAGELEVICAVDVFNEGLDVPDINTVLMLRPTESPVIFLQQLGRGLRRCDGKARLVVVDFIGNHRSFLQKPQALVYLTGEDVPPFVALEKVREQRLELPDGCHVEIETEAIDMLAKLARVSREDLLLYEYLSFRDNHGHRPSLEQLFAAGVQLKVIRDRYESWFHFVDQQGDLDDDQRRVLSRHSGWFADLLKTRMTKSYKMVALEALIEGDALFAGQPIEENARLSEAIIRRHLLLYRESHEDDDRRTFGPAYVRKWRDMPLKVWAAGESTLRPWFMLDGERFAPTFEVAPEDRSAFEEMTQELVAARLREHVDSVKRKEPVDAAEAPAELMVSHTNGRPILRFDRARRPDLPEGETLVEVNGSEYLFRFVKIAVNLAMEPGGKTNVLPELMRGWFGLNAGLPGTRHRVLLSRRQGRWVLEPSDTSSDIVNAGAQVIPFPSLPFYKDLQVACGAFQAVDQHSEAAEQLAVVSNAPVDASRHFVVRAAGDSMDGGDRPIRDGDLVLCEWVTPGSSSEVEGRPFLLLGHDSPETSFAAIKVPIRTATGWKLRSWNPAWEDQDLPGGASVEPVARVLEVVEEATGLTLFGSYDRDAIAQAFGSKNDPSWKVGHRDIDVAGQPHTVLMVTLRKGADVKPEHRYADRFLSRSDFQWESQASTKAASAKGQRIIGHEAEGRAVHLFARYLKHEPFVYCGTVRYRRHDGEMPMRVWFDLDRWLPEGVFRRWAT